MSPRITNRLLTTEEAARLLGCTQAALNKFRMQKTGPPYFRVGRLIRYRRADLSRWLKERRVSPQKSASTAVSAETNLTNTAKPTTEPASHGRRGRPL